MPFEPSTIPVAQLELELSRLRPASCELLADRHLLRRADTKFVTSMDALLAVVAKIGCSYAVVRVGTGHLATYANTYLDTPGLQCFHDHRRGRRVRQKFRIRSYVERGLSFVEVKSRRNSLQTDKVRFEVPYGTRAGNDQVIEVLARHCAFALDLVPVVDIDYMRVMLVGIETEERVTIDLGVTIDQQAHEPLGNVAIVEVKQPSRSGTTPIMQAMRAGRHRARSLSKYVAALAIRPGLRTNLLRPSLRDIARVAR